MLSLLSTRKKRRAVYYTICILLVMLLGSVRSAPIFGKLDFILVESRPWWPDWKPMVVALLKQGDRPIYTDPTTSTVLKGVFNQETVFVRSLSHYPFLNIEVMDSQNRPLWERFPYGAYVILFEKGSAVEAGTDFESHEGDWRNFSQDFTLSPEYSQKDPKRLYRCVVNLQGFTPTWVSWETRHWKPTLADTALFYRYYLNGGKDLVPRLRRDPPENCDVYY